MSQLTLDIDDELLARAEAYAARTGHDLAGLVAEYLASVTRVQVAEVPAIIRRLRGSITLPAGADYRESLTQALQKHFAE